MFDPIRLINIVWEHVFACVDLEFDKGQLKFRRVMKELQEAIFWSIGHGLRNRRKSDKNASKI